VGAESSVSIDSFVSLTDLVDTAPPSLDNNNTGYIRVCAYMYVYIHVCACVCVCVDNIIIMIANNNNIIIIITSRIDGGGPISPTKILEVLLRSYKSY